MKDIQLNLPKPLKTSQNRLRGNKPKVINITSILLTKLSKTSQKKSWEIGLGGNREVFLK